MLSWVDESNYLSLLAFLPRMIPSLKRFWTSVLHSLYFFTLSPNDAFIYWISLASCWLILKALEGANQIDISFKKRKAHHFVNISAPSR
jgi:hypothetical protein